MPLNKLKKENDTITVQNKIQENEIKQMMKDYKEINKDDIINIPIGTYIRYFIKKDDKYLFRLGGYLYNLQPLKDGQDFVTLTMGRNKWYLQLSNALLFIEKTSKEIKNEYDEIIKKQNDYLKELKNRKLLEILKKEKSKEIENYILLSDYQLKKLQIPHVFYGYNIETNEMKKYEMQKCILHKNHVIGIIAYYDNSEIYLDASKYWFYKTKYDERFTKEMLEKIKIFTK